MLLKAGTVIRPCPAGGNFAEQIQNGTKQVSMASGQTRKEPIYTCKYVAGTPFGYAVDVKAPIALQIDDEVYVTEDTPEVYQIVRDGKIFWKNEPLMAEERAKLEAQHGKWKR